MQLAEDITKQYERARAEKHALEQAEKHLRFVWYGTQLDAPLEKVLHHLALAESFIPNAPKHEREGLTVRASALRGLVDDRPTERPPANDEGEDEYRAEFIEDLEQLANNLHSLWRNHSSIVAEEAKLASSLLERVKVL